MGRWLAAAGAERAASGRRGFLLGMESLGAAGAVRAREERQQVCVCVCVRVGIYQAGLRQKSVGGG